MLAARSSTARRSPVPWWKRGSMGAVPSIQASSARTASPSFRWRPAFPDPGASRSSAGGGVLRGRTPRRRSLTGLFSLVAGTAIRLARGGPRG
jgi:hypothetical protein